MAGSGIDTIRSQLQALVARWSVYDGSERSEAQTFLNQLLAIDEVGTKAKLVERLGGKVLMQPSTSRKLAASPSCKIRTERYSRSRRVEPSRERRRLAWRSLASLSRSDGIA